MTHEHGERRLVHQAEESGGASEYLSHSGKPVLHALTGVRFLAALNVVLLHITPLLVGGAPLILARVIGNGDVGVDLFFVLSGFILAYNYLDNGAVDARPFWVARFARIYPAYLLAFGLEVPFWVYYRFTTASPAHAVALLIATAIPCLLMVQGWTPMTVYQWNVPGWSLSSEAFFYAIFPWIGRRLARVPTWALVLTALVASTLIAALPVVNGYNPRPTWLTNLLIYRNPLGRLPEFILGTAIGLIFLRDRFVHRTRGLLCLLLGVAGVIATVATQYSVTGEPGTYPVVVLSFGLVLYGLAYGRTWIAGFLALPMVVALGEASYALYILQEPVAFIFRAALEHSWAVRQHHTYWNFNTWLMVGIYVGILIAASLLSMRFVERPLRRVIRTRFARRAEVRHGVPPVLATSSEPA